MPLDVTALVITYNEAANIDRVLSFLAWVPRVIVLDSGSTDGTLEICKRHSNVDVLIRPFDSFASQCNFGLEQIQTEWCLSLDADYTVPPETANALQAAIERGSADGYFAELVYCIRGRRLRRAILPNRIVLFRTRRARYEQDGHAHRLQLQGRTEKLAEPVLHDDRKSMRRWLMSQDTYAQQELQKLTSKRWRELGWADRVRRLAVVAPWLVPSYYLLVRRGFRDGWAGLDYAAQRALAELVLSIHLIEHGMLGAEADGESRVDVSASR